MSEQLLIQVRLEAIKEAVKIFIEENKDKQEKGNTTDVVRNAKKIEKFIMNNINNQ